MSLESSVSFWDALAFWLVTGGVIATFLGGMSSIMYRRYNRQLVAVIEARNRAEKNASDRAIAEAGARASEANARAAEANLELEKLKAPRTLTPDQRDKLVAELKLAKKEPVEVLALINHGEVSGLRNLIVAVLREAGWDARPNMNSRAPASTIVDGVIVEIYPGTSVHTRDTAIGLVSAFKNAGWKTVGPVDSHNLQGNTRIEILVGNKP